MEMLKEIRNLAKEQGWRSIMSQSALILSILGDVSGIQVSKLTQFESGLGKFLSDNFIDGWLYYSKGNYFLP